MSGRESGTYIELDEAWNNPGWTLVPNSIARCTTISRRVKGWILEVASHAPGRRLTFTEMLKCSSDGRDATYATIKEAVDAGYVTRRQERDKTGRVGIVVYRIHITQQNPRSEPLPGLPDTAGPDTEKPETKREKTRTSLEDQDQNLEDPGGSSSSVTPDGDTDLDPHDEDRDLLGQLLRASRPGVETPPGRSPGSSSKRVAGEGSRKLSADDLAVRAGMFDEFWDAYAHKIGKGEARKAWAKVIKTTDPREVINAAARYARSRIGEDPRFTAHAATWLNGERWLDEPSFARNGHKAPTDGRGGRRNFEDIPDEVWAAPLA